MSTNLKKRIREGSKLNRAFAKKHELLKKIEDKKLSNKETKFSGKSAQWIKKTKESWRRYREDNQIDSDEEEEIRRKLILAIPERKKSRISYGG